MRRNDADIIKVELERLDFVIRRDGEDEAYDWAKRTCKTYYTLIIEIYNLSDIGIKWKWNLREFVGSVIVLGQHIREYEDSKREPEFEKPNS